MVSVVHVSMFVHTAAPCSIFSSVSVLVVSPCPHGRTSVHAAASWQHSVESLLLQHHTLFNSYKLVRPPRPLCRCRPQHERHMVQRLQVLCPAHRLHTVLPIHRFGWTPPALSQVTFCQPRSLRLPRSSPLPHSWRVASASTLPPPPLPISTPLLDAATQTIPHIAVSRDVSTQLSLEEFSL